jgi:hypothetical protein
MNWLRWSQPTFYNVLDVECEDSTLSLVKQNSEKKTHGRDGTK